MFLLNSIFSFSTINFPYVILRFMTIFILQSEFVFILVLHDVFWLALIVHCAEWTISKKVNLLYIYFKAKNILNAIRKYLIGHYIFKLLQNVLWYFVVKTRHIYENLFQSSIFPYYYIFSNCSRCSSTCNSMIVWILM